jgi:hypothetical protein
LLAASCAPGGGDAGVAACRVERLRLQPAAANLLGSGTNLRRAGRARAVDHEIAGELVGAGHGSEAERQEHRDDSLSKPKVHDGRFPPGFGNYVFRGAYGVPFGKGIAGGN